MSWGFASSSIKSHTDFADSKNLFRRQPCDCDSVIEAALQRRSVSTHCCGSCWVCVGGDSCISRPHLPRIVPVTSCSSLPAWLASGRPERYCRKIFAHCSPLLALARFDRTALQYNKIDGGVWSDRLRNVRSKFRHNTEPGVIQVISWSNFLNHFRTL